jgi:hypothetical protein
MILVTICIIYYLEASTISATPPAEIHLLLPYDVPKHTLPFGTQEPGIGVLSGLPIQVYFWWGR